jgi:hypothetical protein
MQAAIILLLAGAFVFWGVREMSKPLSRDELKIEVADLRSHAAEGTKIAEQSAPDKTQEAKKQLDDATPESGLEVQHWQARHLAGQVKTDLEQLSSSFARPQEASRVKNDLEKLYPQLKELEEGLKR